MESEGLRERVTEVAGRLFADLGYDATDMEMIAAASGVPVRRLGALVGDKPHLYLTVFEDLHRLEFEALAGALGAYTPDVAGLQLIGDAFLDFCLAHPRFVAMWMHRWQGDAADLEVETRFAQPVLSAMNQVMAQAVRPDLDLEIAIWNVIWCVHGFVRFGVIGADGHLQGPGDSATVDRFRAYLREMIARLA